MELSEANVKRTWHITATGIEYRMEVDLGTCTITSMEAVSHADYAQRTLPVGSIELQLRTAVLGHIRKALFPGSMA